MIEVLIVMVIVAILMAAAILAFQSTRRSGGATAAMSVGGAYREAVEEFKTDHNGRAPGAIGSADWPIAADGPVSSGALARATGATRTNGRYLRNIPEAVSDSTIGVGAGGNAGHIEYRPNANGRDFEIDVYNNQGQPICSTGTVHVTISVTCERSN